MKLKQVVALLLVLVLLCAAGCGQKENETEKSTAGEETTGAPSESLTVESSDEGVEKSENDLYNITWEDMAEIKMMYLSLGPVPSGLPEVEDAINAITEKEINTHVTIEMIETGNYAKQLGLMMSSGEAVDLLLTMPMDAASFSTIRTQNQLMDITELLTEYAPSIKEILGDKILGTSVSGRTYGVTGNRTYSVSTYIMMRTDVLESLGLLEKAQNMTSLAEYEEILEAVKNSADWNYLAGIVSSDGVGTCLGINPGYLGADNFAEMSSYDALGDTNFLVAINSDGSDPVVKNNFADDEYRAVYERMHKWYELGYVYKDAATSNDMAEELVKNNVAFSYFGNCEAGVETLKSTQCGMPMTCVKLISYPLTTNSTTKFVWTVPNTSKEPEAAMTFLSMMYNDSRIANLLSWGIEGRDYEVVDGEACYIEGQETAYHTADFLFGNQFITLPWQGDGADFRARCQEAEEQSNVSYYLGFAADTSSISNEIAALTNVINEFRGPVGTGAADPQIYEDYLAKLEACGIDKVIQCYQDQLDQWIENNK